MGAALGTRPLRLGEFGHRIEVGKGVDIVENDASTVKLACPQAGFALPTVNEFTQAIAQRSLHETEDGLRR
jgi:hypothetical protein